MIILSDCPERLAGLARAQDGAEVGVESLAPGDQALWHSLGGGSRLWRGATRNPGPGDFWSRAVILEEAPSSQFDRLQESLAAGTEIPGPTACVALRGRGFHGQRNRPWLSAAGNLHLCAVLPEPRLAARDARSLPMLPAVAVRDAVQALSGDTLRPGIKWVNDVLVDERKIAGVLTATEIQGDRVRAVLLGVGLNVAAAPSVPSTPFVPSVGCLADLGVRRTWPEAAVFVLESLGRRAIELATEGATGLLDAYRAASLVIGRDVCIFADPGPGEPLVGTAPMPIARGTVRGIATDLSLILEGVDTPVSKGRLAFAEDCRGAQP